ncbi:MAG: hypothetical protein H8E73_08345 [Planctomycetes bacterium]|nr:hypothetical protein [Planctomycetota bacterium]
MKETAVQLLQDRMTKCTNGQFWSVAVICTLNGFCITQKQELRAVLPASAYIIAFIAACAYAVFYIIRRHTDYYAAKRNVVEWLDSYVPEFMGPDTLSMWSPRSLVGLIFFLAPVLGATMLGCLVLAGP